MNQPAKKPPSTTEPPALRLVSESDGDRPQPMLDWWSQPRNADGSYVAIGRASLNSLTSLRFFAAAYVVLHHLINIGLLHTQGAGADRSATWYLALGTQGHTGVTFFFVLSGFILAWCYHTAFAQSAQERKPKRHRFWRARFARVWPLHAAMFIAFIPITLMSVSGLADLFRMAWTGFLNVTLLHAWVPFGGPDGIADTFNAPSWTLSVEAFFYFVCPAVIAFLVAKKRWGIAQLALLAAASWLALGGVALALGDAPHNAWIFSKFPPLRFSDFLIGICAGLIVVQLRQRQVLLHSTPSSESDERLPIRDRRGLWTGIELAALMLVVAGPLFVALNPALLPVAVTTSWLHLPAFTALILIYSLERGLLSQKLFSWAPLVWLGEVSYALYLTHMFLVLTAFRVGIYDRFGVITTSVLLFAAAIAVSGVVHERFEKPARARIVRGRDESGRARR